MLEITPHHHFHAQHPLPRAVKLRIPIQEMPPVHAIKVLKLGRKLLKWNEQVDGDSGVLHVAAHMSANGKSGFVQVSTTSVSAFVAVIEKYSAWPKPLFDIEDVETSRAVITSDVLRVMIRFQAAIRGSILRKNINPKYIVLCICKLQALVRGHQDRAVDRSKGHSRIEFRLTTNFEEVAKDGGKTTDGQWGFKMRVAADISGAMNMPLMTTQVMMLQAGSIYTLINLWVPYSDKKAGATSPRSLIELVQELVTMVVDETKVIINLS